MRKIKFNIKDRKMLYTMLSLVLVCVFTLTIAYSALSAVLTIQGNARVSAADWDIYLNNPRVTNGSATTNVPEIKTSSTLEFSTTLNMPGDFYEFVVDVVNSGDIDAMIENVVKTPDLTEEQAKFLKYEVSYQNGESITTKQLLAKDTTMPIKVRIEYRKDLSNTDLPTGQVVLDLALTLEYIQSDGTGSSVNNNGVYKPVSANGDINDIGTIVTIGTEQFYTIGTEGDNVKLFAMYNLYVGGVYNKETRMWTAYGEEATGIQDSNMTGYLQNQQIRKGVLSFANYIYWCDEQNNILDEYKNGNNSYYYVVDENSNLYVYLENYENILSNYGIDIVETRLLKQEDLDNIEDYSLEINKWLYSTSYWMGTSEGKSLRTVLSELDWAWFESNNIYDDSNYGVRPVIVISKSLF